MAQAHWNDEDKKQGFNIRPENVSDLIYMENGMGIVGVKPTSGYKTPGGIKLKYPLQLQRINFGEGPRLVFVPIDGCGETIELYSSGRTAKSPLSAALRGSYMHGATVEHGLTEEGLARVTARMHADRQKESEEAEELALKMEKEASAEPETTTEPAVPETDATTTTPT